MKLPPKHFLNEKPLQSLQTTWCKYHHQTNRSLNDVGPLVNEDNSSNFWAFTRHINLIVMVSSTLACCIIYFANLNWCFVPL